jgi:hypothetical protein
MLNASKGWIIGMSATPRVQISSTAAFPGAKCEEMETIYSSVKKRYAWQFLAIYGKPRNGSVVFPSEIAGIALEPSQFDVFGFVCY